MSEVKLNLYQKIQAVMRDVTYLQKDGKVEFKTTKYKAISEEKVTMTVRDSLIKHGLVILPVEQSHAREGTLSTVDTKYKIVDVDSGEYEIIVSSGTGADTQDKGVGKAMTYSYKYLLLRTFAIPTGEDPDKISSAELDEKHAITSEQVGQIKLKVGTLAQMRGVQKEKVYESIKTTERDLVNLTAEGAAGRIASLDAWIAKSQKAAKETAGA